MDAVELTCAEKLQDIPEPTTHDLSTVHPECLHLPSITLPTMPKQAELLLLCSLATRDHAKPYYTMTESKYQTKATCSTQRPAPSHGHQASEVSISSPIMGQRHVWSFCSAYLGLHQYTPAKKHPLSFFEAGRGLKVTRAKSICLAYVNKNQFVCRPQPL